MNTPILGDKIELLYHTLNRPWYWGTWYWTLQAEDYIYSENKLYKTKWGCRKAAINWLEAKETNQ